MAGGSPRLTGLLLIAPALIFLAVFYLVPLGYMVEESLRSSVADPDPRPGLSLYQFERVCASGRSSRAL